MLAAGGQPGENPETIAPEKANWVNQPQQDIQTYDVMFNMAKLLIRRSQTASTRHNLFTLP